MLLVSRGLSQLIWNIDSRRSSVFQIPCTGESVRSRGYLFRLKTPITRRCNTQPEVAEEIRKVLEEANKVLDYEPINGECDLEHTANVVHISCLQLAKTRLPQITVRLLCTIARVLRLVVAWKDAGHLLSKHGGLSTLPVCTSSSTDLGSLIQATAHRLPSELGSMILKYIPYGLFSSLAHSSRTLSWISHHLLQNDPAIQPSFLWDNSLSQYTNIRTLGANVVDILGEKCLEVVGDDPSNAYHCQIQLSDQEMMGLSFSLGIYGVLGMQVNYKDGSASPWLGQGASTWLKYIPGCDLKDLRILSDSVKMMSASFGVDGPVGSNTMTQLLRNWEMSPACQMKYSFIDLVNFSAAPIRGNQNTRYAQQLSLKFDDDKRHGLTVFCSAAGVSCVQFDGVQERKLGTPSKTCCAITFYLDPYEKVEMLFVVTRGSKGLLSTHGPYLLVRTSLGRSLYYGRYLYYGTSITQHLPPTKGYFSSFGHDTTHSATALFIDPISANANGTLKMLGVALEPRSTEAKPTELALSVPMIPYREPSMFLSAHYFKAYVSRATFSGAETIHVQRRGLRCTGVSATLMDGRVLTLGQWNPSRPEEISILYEKQHGPLHTITFILSAAEDMDGHVEDIVINDRETTKPHFRWDNICTEIAWFFTSQYDCVVYWIGEDMEIGIQERDAFPFVVAS